MPRPQGCVYRLDAMTATDKDRSLRTLQRADNLAELLDDQFRIPVLDRRVGLDPIIGLLPVGGDWVSWAASLYILWIGARLDAPPSLLIKMGWNIGVDLIVGYVPIAGDLFDAGFKANRRNVDLLLAHTGARRRNGRIERTSPGRDETDGRGGAAATLQRWGLVAALVVIVTALAALPVALLFWLAG